MGSHEAAVSPAPTAERRAIVAAARLAGAVLLLAIAGVAEVGSLGHGEISPLPLLLAIGAIAVGIGRLGRVLRYLVPVLLGAIGYFVARQYVTQFKLSVHYLPQLRVDEWLMPGPIPTVWLQEHLYHGRIGPLEVAAVVVYASHFFVPLIFGGALILAGKSRGFGVLVFALLATAVTAEVLFVLFPTAPPWLAAEHGDVTGVHHLLKQTFVHLHLTTLADASGDRSKYDVTAAVPSLHAAFPVVCLLVSLRARLPRIVSLAFVVNVAAVVFAIVYLGEHYVFDALTGMLLGGVCWLTVERLTRSD
jgi:PAP2 superfamily